VKTDDILKTLADRQFKRLMGSRGTFRYRRRLGNETDMWAIQGRVIGVLALGKSMGPVLAEAGRKLGTALATRSLPMIQNLPNYRSIANARSLSEALLSSEWGFMQSTYQLSRTGILNMVRYEKNDLVVFQVEECATCTGLPNLGEAVCYYLGGQLAGATGVITGRSVGFVETMCQAKGDSLCEFTCNVSKP